MALALACKLHRRIALRRKLQILRSLTKSKSVKKRSIITDAFLYIYKLKLKVEAMKKEYQHLVNNIQEVKVENIGKGYLIVRVTCKKGDQDMLASVVEVFEHLNLNVVQMQATVTCDCDHFFRMEAIIKSHIDAAILNRALLMVVHALN